MSEDIPLGTINKKPLGKIRKCPDSVLAELGHKGKLQASHPRFGPFYREDESESEFSGKKEAWDKILAKSGDENNTLESYLLAMRKIEKDARDAYGDEALHTLTESQFRWMMIEDGCFFLQLALLILGVSSKQLGYPDNHIIFGKKQNREDIKRWIESMFFLGNQIPLVVLNELMKQRFFQNILAVVNRWDVPSEVPKRVLYEFLVLPALEYGNQVTSASRKGFGGKGNWLVKQQPSDLLHALQCLMVGSREGSSRDLDQDETEEDDLESRPNTESKDINLSATKLEKKGIHFRKWEQMGCREIVFTDYIIFACLYLPTFPVDGDTEALWKTLKCYEMIQQQGKGKCEVRSYLQFMSDLICTYEDVRLLAKKGIIEANSLYYKEKLPRMLSKLAGKDKSTTDSLHLLSIQLKDYSVAPWEKFRILATCEKFKLLALLLFILTAVQAIIALVTYFRTPSQK